MHALGKRIQFFAACANPLKYKNAEMRRALEIIDTIHRQAEDNSDLMAVCTNMDEINMALGQDKIAALISIEGGEALQGSLASLRMFYRLGVRSLILTWNYRNELADGALEKDSCGGLSSFGRRDFIICSCLSACSLGYR